VFQARECARLLDLSLFYIWGLTFESFKELGARQKVLRGFTFNTHAQVIGRGEHAKREARKQEESLEEKV